MKTTVAAAFLLVAGAQAFSQQPLTVIRESTIVVSMGYVPDGFTAETFKKFKADEEKKKKANLGNMGPRGFQSRSMQAFQEAMERGEAEHLMPVFNAKERVKKGELKTEDIPYMQRGGSWDDSDVRGAKKKQWSLRDKEYTDGGFKKEQSTSILGYGEGLDWTGAKKRAGPESVPGAKVKFSRNYKAPNVKDMQAAKAQAIAAAPKKKLFGLW